MLTGPEYQELLELRRLVQVHKRKARQPGVRAEMIATLPVKVERCIVDPKEQCPVCKSPS